MESTPTRCSIGASFAARTTGCRPEYTRLLYGRGMKSVGINISQHGIEPGDANSRVQHCDSSPIQRLAGRNSVDEEFLRWEWLEYLGFGMKESLRRVQQQHEHRRVRMKCSPRLGKTVRGQTVLSEYCACLQIILVKGSCPSSNSAFS